MAYQDPGNPRRVDDYIDRTGEMGWTPICWVSRSLQCSRSCSLARQDRPTSQAPPPSAANSRTSRQARRRSQYRRPRNLSRHAAMTFDAFRSVLAPIGLSARSQLSPISPPAPAAASRRTSTSPSPRPAGSVLSVESRIIRQAEGPCG